jgi:NodT family efflux transporter outer membrane factor (OMF) lipoprotein
MMHRSFLLLLPFLGLVAACTVGPNYKGPPPLASAGSEAAGFVRGGNAISPPAARWWTTLNDPTLNGLEERALAGNYNVAAAEARVREARSALRIERANELPQVAATGMYAHADLPPINLGGNTSNNRTVLNFFNVGFDASWEIDLFGGQRRTIEAARATLGASEASLSDAQVQLGAEVAQAYVNLRDRQQRMVLIRQESALEQRTLALTEQRYTRGTASALDVERLRTQFENTSALAVPLQAEIESYLDALAVLTGSTPGSLDATLQAAGAVPLPPASVAVGDPAALLRRRPDIRSAERRLAAATARIGVAEATRFPRLSFMGILGIGGTSLSALTNLNNIAAIALPQLQWSVLDFGRGAARVRQSEAQRDEAEALYRQAVLAALQDAEDSLSRFGHRRETVASLVRVRDSATRAAALMEQRYRAGTATLIDALDAERQRIAAEQNLADAVAALTNDYVAIQKALGLGWEAAS